MVSSIHQAITAAVSELCNCSFSVKFLRPGKFRCWNSPSEVTYISSVVGTPARNSSHLLGFLDSWVRSEEAVVDVGCVSLRVLNGRCGVGVGEECGVEGSGISPNTLSLVSQDPAVISCVQKCMRGSL